MGACTGGCRQRSTRFECRVVRVARIRRRDPGRGRPRPELFATTEGAIRVAGASYLRVRFGQEVPRRSDAERCPRCGTPRGAYHHPECQLEQCPRCQGALCDCGCLQVENLDANWGPREPPAWVRQAAALAFIGILTASAVLAMQWMMASAQLERTPIPGAAPRPVPQVILVPGLPPPSRSVAAPRE